LGETNMKRSARTDVPNRLLRDDLSPMSFATPTGFLDYLQVKAESCEGSANRPSPQSPKRIIGSFFFPLTRVYARHAPVLSSCNITILTRSVPVKMTCSGKFCPNRWYREDMADRSLQVLSIPDDPRCTRVTRDIDMQDSPTVMADDEETIEYPERDSRDREGVARPTSGSRPQFERSDHGLP